MDLDYDTIKLKAHGAINNVNRVIHGQSGTIGHDKMPRLNCVSYLKSVMMQSMHAKYGTAVHDKMSECDRANCLPNVFSTVFHNI